MSNNDHLLIIVELFYPFSQIRSDFEDNFNIRYALQGIGANQAPFNVFVVDSKTGFIRVTKILDREEIDTYNVRVTHFQFNI